MTKNFFEGRFNKALLFMITLSFILSSIGGILFFSNKYNVITVDNEKISYKKFLDLLGKEREIAYSNGNTDVDYLTSKEFTTNSVEKIINSELLKSFVKNNNLSVSRSFVIEKILNNNDFKENRHFNSVKYKKFLDDIKTTEEDYIKLMSDFYVNISLLNMFNIYDNFNKDILSKVIEKSNNYKVVNLYEISKNSLKIEEINISDEELKKHYNRNISRFTHEEERKVDFIKIDLTRTDRALSDKEIEDYYKSNLDRYKIPETYDIYYLESENKSNLDKIVKFKGGKELINGINNILNKKEEEVTINGLPVEALNYVFGKENIEKVELKHFSDIVKKNETYMVFYLKNKNESGIISLENAKSSIKEELQRDTSKEAVSNNYERIQKIIKENRDISNISKILNTNLETVGYIKFDDNVKGLKIDKQKIFNSKNSELIQVFSSNYLYVYTVSDIKKTYLDEFENVKDELFTEVKNIKENEAYVKQVSTIDKNKYIVKRGLIIRKNEEKYDKSFIDELYKLENGKTTGVYFNDTRLYFADIIGDKGIDKNDENFFDLERVAEIFGLQVNGSISYYYLEYLRGKYNIYINHNLLNYL